VLSKLQDEAARWPQELRDIDVTFLTRALTRVDGDLVVACGGVPARSASA
jgi:hypothetical protein